MSRETPLDLTEDDGGALVDGPAHEAEGPRVAAPAATGGVGVGLVWFVLITGVLMLVGAHVMTLGYVKFANVDEAYAAALAKRLLDGHLLYQGAVSQRGPLMYYSFYLLAKLFGWDSILAIRIAALTLSIAVLLLTYEAARRLFSARAGLLASLIVAYALSLGFPPWDGLAMNGETLLLPPLIVGVTLVALAMRAEIGSRDRRWMLALAGVAVSAAVCIKQTALAQVAPVVVLVLADARARSARWVRAAGDLGIFLAAGAALPLFFVLHAFRQGTLRDLIYYTVTYNLGIHTLPQHGRQLLLFRWFERTEDQPLFMLTMAAVVTMAVARWAPRLWHAARYRAPLEALDGFTTYDYVLLQGVVGLVVAVRIPQLFPHYFLLPLPFVAIAISEAVFRAVEGSNIDRALPQAFAACSLAGIFASGALVNTREKFDGRVSHDRSPEDAAKYIQKTTAPDAKIFVWGFSPWLYQYSHRAPAGRFVFSTYVTGFIPWAYDRLPDEWRSVVPGAMGELLGDLDREQPELIVDAGSVMIARSMRAYPDASAWLHANYCFDARVGAFDIYRRKHGTPCATDYFPYPAFNVDHLGVPLPVMSPTAVDFPDSCPLPWGDPARPARFQPHNVCGETSVEEEVEENKPGAETCNFGFDRAGDPDDSTRPVCGGPPVEKPKHR